ncbi:hypothetical protein N8301_05910 [Cyclobacteriaceae bacterium]|nr:hypothetical protein [Cyclobacteriaceae bacterium]
MKSPSLEKHLVSDKLPNSIKGRIKEVIDEEDAYAADELVSLSEEILLQIAAIGISLYLSQPKQREVFNDFILQLFTSKSHAYNAGPLYRWAANMIKDLDGDMTAKIYSLYWSDGELNGEMNKLSTLRNAVMHGFFVLPASRNHEEAKNLGDILSQIIDLDLFSINTELSYHFLSKKDDIIFFNNEWSIQDDQWKLFDDSHDFGKLTRDIQYELSEKYHEDQLKLVQQYADNDKVLESIDTFIKSNSKGSMFIWARPNFNLLIHYANLINQLDESKYLKVFYSLDSHGVNATDDFLLKRLVKMLSAHNNIDMPIKNIRKSLTKIRKDCDKQVIVILNNIHTSLFNSDHLLHLKDVLYDNNILLIAFGNNYPWMNQFFNHSFSLDDDPYFPNEKEWKKSFVNYLRFKGPNNDIPNEQEDYKELLMIINKLISTLKKEKIVVARRFADKYKYSMEYVHEAFSILHPFLKFESKSFKLDELDPLYNFPNEVNESSRMFFSIGRRDGKLEYQHKALQL